MATLRAFGTPINMETAGDAIAAQLIQFATDGWAEVYRDNVEGMAITGNLSAAGGLTGTVERFIYAAHGSAEIQGPLPDFEIVNLSMTVTNSFRAAFFAADMGVVFGILLEGNDTIYGFSAGNNRLYGGAGNDLFFGGTHGDYFDGGSGTNTVSYGNAPVRVVVDLVNPGFNTGFADDDTYVAIANLIGSDFDDFLYADDNANRVSGGKGNDTLAGLGGGDRFDGGAGSDTVTYDSSLAVRASLLNRALNTGDARGDRYTSIENLDGGSGGDTLYGNNSANQLRGNSYPNLGGLFDADTLFGLGGNDKLFGHDGSDRLIGGLGADRLTGGDGTDRFIFNAPGESTNSQRDRIVDFRPIEGDRIQLSGIDARSNIAGNQAFSFIGTAAFSGVSGQLRYQRINGESRIMGDIDGNKVADFTIISELGVRFFRTDFVL